MNLMKQLYDLKPPSQNLKLAGKNTTEPHPIVLEEDREKYPLRPTLVETRPLTCIA